ncbi:hypothetical protein HDU85_007048 [Gaertneriomyces sp. JEL0708]|nr:hypothetical protein HDU85_007048 [Gaertneriomyces sp. JEL0708]
MAALLARASATSGALYVLGDLLNQVVVEPRTNPPNGLSQTQSTNVDWVRALKFGFTGALLHGPYFLYGFRMLDRVCGPSRSLSTVLKKSALGQVVLFPPYVVAFLSLTAVLDGETPWTRLKSRFMPILVNGSIFWPAANFVNFRFVPSHWRIAYVNVVGIGWNTYLSFTTRPSVAALPGSQLAAPLSS